MAFLRDDDALAMAVLALCDALDDGATDAEKRIKPIATARKYAHRVIDRAKKKPKPETTPADEPEGDTDE